MARPHLFAQIYGYAVCLTAVIVGLNVGHGAVQDAFDLADPLHAKQGWGQDVPPTFEEFLAQERGQIDNTNTPPDPEAKDSVRATTPLSDAQLRQIYQSRRDEIITTRHFQALKSLMANLLLLIAAIALFATHWRWLRRLPDASATT